VNEFLVRAHVGGFEFTVFPDGRAIIKGTSDPGVARSLYAKYVGM
jgi:adenylyltransferase/sulfurtransferase